MSNPVNANSIQLIKPSPNLGHFIIENNIVNTIVAEIRAIPQFESLTNSIDLVLHICNLIENLVVDNGLKSKDKKFKQNIAIKVYQLLNFQKPQDKEFLLNAIEFLHSSNQIVKVPVVKKIWSFIKKSSGRQIMA